MVPAAVWAGAYLGAAMLGFATGLIAALVYSAFAPAVGIVSGWPEP